MTTIVFIPIRKGSKGIPNKNLKILCGKPLICWPIDTLLEVDEDITIWVATDSDEAEAILRSRYGNSINIYRRSASSATDTSPTIDVVVEFISNMELSDTTRFILVQATTPFVSVTDFNRLLSEMRANCEQSFISCCKIKRFCWSEDGHPLNYTVDTKPLRQNYGGILIENGAFYATTVKAIRHSGLLLSGDIKVIETSPGTLIDIDEDTDWRTAEHFIADYLNDKL